MSQPVFRFAKPADAEQLAQLRILMQSEVNGLDPAAAKPEYRQRVIDYFLEGLQTGDFMGAVAELNGSLIAANGVVFYKKPPSIKGKDGIFGYVTNVYTNPAWRGKGVAKKLLDMLVTEARKKDIDRLHLSSTDVGLTLYKRAGFVTPQSPQLELRFAEECASTTISGRQ